jgi:uncharacterized protein
VSAVGANAERDFRNEANTFGYNVEIDPLSPTRPTPVKRVSMGRMAHEGAVCSLPKAGQPLAFYMGCDARNEYIYKFVSTALWDPKDIGGGISEAGDKYLNEGKLYAARFDADGRGQWIELNIKDARKSPTTRPSSSENQAEIYTQTRIWPPTPWAPPRWTAPSGPPSIPRTARFTSP